MDMNNLINISEKKNEIQDLLNDIFNEYNRMNESKIQNNCEKDLEMRGMIDTIRTLENSERENTDEIRKLKKIINEYELLINNLNSKLEMVEEDKKEENRFDMLRIQAKEILEKDREIERLNGLLKHYKNKNNDQIDKVITKMESKNISNINLQEVIEPVNEETNEVNPNFIYDSDNTDNSGTPDIPDTSDKSEVVNDNPKNDNSNISDLSDKSEIVNDESEKDNINEKSDTPEIVNDDSEKDKGKLIIVTSKKIKYYAYENEEPQIVYEFNGNKIANKPLGKRLRNEKGKYKVQLFTS